MTRKPNEPEGVNLKEHTMEFGQDLRSDFPTLARSVRGSRLSYLDNGATSQKPLQVIQVVRKFYEDQNSNIHRGVHFLSQEATSLYEEAREKIRKFINAGSFKEVIITSGTTESINLVADCLERSELRAGDEVLISHMEHHSNIVPWQMICERIGANLKVIPINEIGELKTEEFDQLFNERTKLVAVTHVSNSLGTINPVQRIIRLAKSVGAKVLLDGAQAVPHFSVDVKELDCDFYAFSAHKMFGPTGVGVLYGKKAILDKLPPYKGGGDMIESVSFEKTTYNQLPHKFEAGTPNICGVLGLGAAIDYINEIGYSTIEKMEKSVYDYAMSELKQIDQIRFVGRAEHKVGVISFLMGGSHPYDVGTILDQMGVAVRTGHHCTQPLMDRYNIPGTIRASLAFYNNQQDIDALVEGLKKSIKMLGI